MRPRRQRIIAVILAAFIIGIIGYITRYPFHFEFDFGSGFFEVYLRPLPAWVTLPSVLLSGLPVAVLFIILWRRRPKQH